MKTPKPLHHLKMALILVFSVLIMGTAGYMLIEHLSIEDSLYTTIIMMATVGNVERPLSEPGRMFTIAVIILGVGSMLYTFGAGMEYMIEGHLSQEIRRRLMENKIAALHNHYIVCGYGRVGLQIVEEFTAARQPFIVIDDQERNISDCMERGYKALLGDATSDDMLRKAGIEHAKCLLVATDNDASNTFITLSARHLSKTLYIVARANHYETEAKLKLAGADRVLSPYAIGGHRMANLALQPGVMEFFDTITKAGNVELAVQEVIIPATSPLVGKTLVEAQNTLSYGTMLVALKRPSGVMPGSRPEAYIEIGDTVIVVGAGEQLALFKEKNNAQ